MAKDCFSFPVDTCTGAIVPLRGQAVQAQVQMGAFAL